MAKPSDFFAIATIIAGTGIGAAIDLRTRRVPNPLTMGLAAIGVLYAAVGIGGLSIGASLGGLALGLALMLPGHLIGATGAGDVKLFAAAGAFVGPAHILTAFLYTALAGGAIAIVDRALPAPLAADRRRHGSPDCHAGDACPGHREPARRTTGSRTPRPSPSARCWPRWDSDQSRQRGT